MRKGQWLWNSLIRNEMRGRDTLTQQSQMISNKLWNMTDKEFDEIMEKWLAN